MKSVQEQLAERRLLQSRSERLKDVGASGYLPRIIHREGSTAPIIWPADRPYSCPTYYSPNDPIDSRCLRR